MSIIILPMIISLHLPSSKQVMGPLDAAVSWRHNRTLPRGYEKSYSLVQAMFSDT